MFIYGEVKAIRVLICYVYVHVAIRHVPLPVHNTEPDTKTHNAEPGCGLHRPKSTPRRTESTCAETLHHAALWVNVSLQAQLNEAIIFAPNPRLASH